MSERGLYAAIAVLALGAGAVFWSLDRGSRIPAAGAPTIGPAALYAASFTDEAGQPQPLGRFQGRILVVNFWATWCAPCREEMPALDRVARRWSDRGVSMVGLSAEEPAEVAAFRRGNPTSYALWTGGAAVESLAQRLGNLAGVLPYSAIIDGAGHVAALKVGPYTEAELETNLQRISANSPQPRPSS